MQAQASGLLSTELERRSVTTDSVDRPRVIDKLNRSLIRLGQHARGVGTDIYS